LSKLFYALSLFFITTNEELHEKASFVILKQQKNRPHFDCLES